MKKKHILYGTAAVLASATLGTATVSANTFIVNVDGVQTQMSEYEDNLPIETVAASEASLIESGFAEGLQLDHVDYSTPGTTIFNFTRPGVDLTPETVETRTFNFVVNVDGVEIQNQPMTLPVDEIEAWLQNEAATFTNATVERVVESGKVTLNVTSNPNVVADWVNANAPEVISVDREEEFVEDDYVNSNKEELKNPVKEDSDKEVVADKEETTDKTAEDKAKDPAVTFGNKKATAKKDAQYAKDANLPSTGDNSSATFAIAGLAIMGLGLAGVAKRKFNN